MKILVFENEIPAVSEAFNHVNFLDFDGVLEITYIDKSQGFNDFRNLSIYNMVFVDIDLSVYSDKDGYGIITDLKSYNYHNIIILTGNMVHDEIEIRGWKDIDVLTKPIFLDDLVEKIKKFA